MASAGTAHRHTVRRRRIFLAFTIMRMRCRRCDVTEHD
jgi:hypothetical protein